MTIKEDTKSGMMNFECSYGEVLLLLVIREMQFGKLEVTLQNGEPKRVVTTGSLFFDDPRQVLSWVTNDKSRVELFKKLNLIK